MTRKLLLGIAAAAALVAGSACDKQLTVSNPNQGETERVLGLAADAEAVLGSYYKRWSSGLYGSTTDLQGMANIQSLMNYSSLANNCQNARTPFTGAVNNNAPGNTCNGEQYRLYSIMGEVNRVASTILYRMKNKQLDLVTPARTLRLKSYAEFLRGMSIGYVALMHDSAAVVTDSMGPLDPGTLVSYKELADSAYAAFERAIVYANTTYPVVPGDQTFPLPDDWIPPTGSFKYTSAEFIRLIRSYRARIRANLARNPTERAAVDWAAVIADAQNGITSDNLVLTSTTLGPINSWRQQYESFTTWHQMPPFIIGMADVSGSYATWIAQPLGDRGSNNTSFTLVTPDTRFPQGATRAAQQADFAISSCAAGGTVCSHLLKTGPAATDTVRKPVYFVNRPTGNDVYSGASFGQSNYDFIRFHSWHTNGDAASARNGKTTYMTKAEIDLLQAEGQYRLGNFQAAAALVNATRTAANLPAITAFDATSPVPGGTTNCVPKVPIAPNFNTIACGNLWEALKYEKRIETAYTHYAPWFLDMRGWGDLPETTPVFWPVPYQDYLARGKPTSAVYGTGLGVGNAPNSTAAKGTYGW